MRRYFTQGAGDTFSKLCFISAVMITVMPVMAAVTFAYSGTTTSKESKENVSAYLVILFFLMIYRISAGSAFTTLGIVVNNSIDQSMRGTMNGLIMTAGSLGNAAGPIVGSICYAAALTLPSNKWLPLDGRLVFVCGGLMAILLALFAKRHMI